MERTDPAAGRVFQLRSGHAAILHDHRSGTVARHAGTEMATGGGNAAGSTARAGRTAASTSCVRSFGVMSVRCSRIRIHAWRILWSHSFAQDVRDT